MNIDELSMMTTIAATAARRECVSHQVQRGFDALRGISPVLTELGLTLAFDERWAQSGVALNKERLLKTTTDILRDTFGFHHARALLPE